MRLLLNSPVPREPASRMFLHTSRSAAITDAQHLLGHTPVKTTEKAYAAFVKIERFIVTALYVVVSALTQLFGLLICENLGPVDLKIRAGVTCRRRAHFGNSGIHNIAAVTRTIQPSSYY